MCFWDAPSLGGNTFIPLTKRAGIGLEKHFCYQIFQQLLEKPFFCLLGLCNICLNLIVFLLNNIVIIIFFQILKKVYFLEKRTCFFLFKPQPHITSSFLTSRLSDAIIKLFNFIFIFYSFIFILYLNSQGLFIHIYIFLLFVLMCNW